jgi:hypothetical protein
MVTTQAPSFGGSGERHVRLTSSEVPTGRNHWGMGDESRIDDLVRGLCAMSAATGGAALSN